MSCVPPLRIRAANDRSIRANGEFVTYWMTATRRSRWNFALDRAVEHARGLKKPLVVFEALRVGYPWASDRLHRFLLDGMADQQRSFAKSAITYYPYVEPRAGAGQGLLEALAERSCVVVTDEFPCFFLPRMVASAAARLPVLCEQVDSNGLLPLRAADRDFPTAYAFRRFLQHTLPAHLNEAPRANPLEKLALPQTPSLDEIQHRWPPAEPRLLAGDAGRLAALPIDHTVPVARLQGGEESGEKAVDQFLGATLGQYLDNRNEPALDATSGLSPYLHFGHVSAHQILARIATREDWTTESLTARASGKRAGWWGMSEAAEAFLDQLVTWRELGYNFSSQRADYDRYESLPDWAQATLAKHAADRREYVYTVEQFAAATTHDRLWNAAQRQLADEGKLHNYMRMLWGKKILEWSATPREALDTMIELNNKFALDGRNPNSYSGIFWILGRFDRPWGPERPVFGTVRYMSSANTARKFDVQPYLDRYGGPAERTLFD